MKYKRNDIKKDIINLIKREKAVTTSFLSRILNINYNTAMRHLTELEEDGVLIKIIRDTKQKRTRKWILKDEVLNSVEVEKNEETVKDSNIKAISN